MPNPWTVKSPHRRTEVSIAPTLSAGRSCSWGLAELQQRGDIPTKVIINEAVELAKRYGPADCYRFVNAVLDRASRGIDGRKA